MQSICGKPHSSLLPGKVPVQYFRLLTDISPIRSKKVIQALQDFFVEGRPRIHVCDLHGVGQGYLSVKIKELNALNRKIHGLCASCSSGVCN